MKNLMTVLAFSLTLAAPMSFAGEGSCTCSDTCMTQCQKGDSKDCKCKSCDCAKSGKCSHDQCHKKEEAKKK